LREKRPDSLRLAIRPSNAAMKDFSLEKILRLLVWSARSVMGQIGQ
jgi:hypothetical protein